MEWTNIGLTKLKNLDSDKFTTDFGIDLRKKMHPLFKRIIENNIGKETIIVSYPNLDNDSYIFTAGHSFPGEVATNLYAIDRNVYTLVGTTDQVDHNPEMYLLWLIGMIYVNKLDKQSRKEAYKKMLRILRNNSSIMLFPEGVLNNTENLDCVTLYPGFYHLSVESGKKVVPIVSHYDYLNNTVLVAASNPIDFINTDKSTAKSELRDALATLRFNLSRLKVEEARKLNRVLTSDEFLLLNPELRVEQHRDELIGDIHLNYMAQRKNIYNEVKWTNSDCWEEEIMSYKEKNVTDFSDVYSFIDKINFLEKDYETIEILTPILKRQLEYKKYDFKNYMRKNWDK